MAECHIGTTVASTFQRTARRLDRGLTIPGAVDKWSCGPANPDGRVSDPALHALSYLRTLSFAPAIEQESGTLGRQPVLIVEGKGLAAADVDTGCVLSRRVFLKADSLLLLKEEEVADCRSGPVLEQVITYEEGGTSRALASATLTSFPSQRYASPARRTSPRWKLVASSTVQEVRDEIRDLL